MAIVLTDHDLQLKLRPVTAYESTGLALSFGRVFAVLWSFNFRHWFTVGVGHVHF